MSSELNKLLYQTISGDATYQGYTGATATDPRIYKRKIPDRIKVSQTYQAFSVYRLMGTTKLAGSSKISVGQKDDQTYSLEIYGVIDTVVEDIAGYLHDLFYEASFLTENLKVGYTWATRGSIDFDEGRKLWVETMTIYYTKILMLSAS
jgi:hypothetical protein